MTKHYNFTEVNVKENNNMNEARIPGLVWIILSYLAAIIVQTIAEIPFSYIFLFTLLIMTFSIIYFLSSKFLPHRAWLYFVLQGLILYSSTFFMHDQYVSIVSLFPLLLWQVIGMISQNRWLIFSLLYTLFIIAIVINVPRDSLPLFLLISFPLSLIVIGYAVNFFRLVEEKNKTKGFLLELEEAYLQVEHLTLSIERQRMARDLHDTLAQSLSAFKMQSEAINAHLTNQNYVRAKEINQLSMKQARTALSDARMVIDNLRENDRGIILRDYIKDSIDLFEETSNIQLNYTYKVNVALPPTVIENVAKIIKESLTNISNHSKADRVLIDLTYEDKYLYILIEDDGIGFNVENVIEQKGHYGILGMKERVMLLEGQIDILSQDNIGTKITVKIPIKEVLNNV